MMKITIAIFLALMISGCGAQKSKSIAFKPYQMVDAKYATLLQSGQEKGYCYLCGMDLVRFYKTSHAAQSENGKHYQYCSIHCLEDHLGQGITLKNPKVVDLTSLKFISVAEAHYVVGSKIRGTMSRTSKYAFKNIEDAKKFKDNNGGTLMNFQEAREKAQEDFKHYRN